MDTVQDVLVHHQAHELRMGVLVVEGEGDQGGERFFGRQALEIERGFGAADARVGLLEHGEVEPLLAAEIIVDHALAGARALGDGVDPRAAIALLGEFPRCDIDDVALGAFRVVYPLALAGPCARSGFHFSTIVDACVFPHTRTTSSAASRRKPASFVMKLAGCPRRRQRAACRASGVLRPERARMAVARSTTPRESGTTVSPDDAKKRS